MWIDVVKLFLDARCCDGITGCGLMPLLGMLSIDSVVNTELFSFIKSLGTDNSGDASLKKEGQLVADTKQKANILNKQFQSVFTTESIDNIPNKGMSPHPVIHLLGGLDLIFLYRCCKHVFVLSGPDVSAVCISLYIFCPFSF
jgi:hypothetical protein